MQHPLLLSQLSSGSVDRLCRALECAGFLPPAPGQLNGPANNAYPLDRLRHKKAKKLLVCDDSSGPGLNLHHFTVKELQALLKCLGMSFKFTDRKAALVANVIEALPRHPERPKPKELVHVEGQKSAAPTSPASRPEKFDTSMSKGRQSATSSRSLRAHPTNAIRHIVSASQHSRDYSTHAGATALDDRQPQGHSSDNDLTAKPLSQDWAVQLPHRNKSPFASAVRNLFGPWQQQVVPESKAQSQQGQTAAADAEGQTANVRQQRAALEKQWGQQERGELLQTDPWTGPEVMRLVGDVQRLHSRGQGRSAPSTAEVIQRLQFFPDCVQGYAAYKDKPSDVIAKGSSHFGCRGGFAMLLRGPEQYLTRGPGFIYIYHLKEVPNECKVGVCKDLPERRVVDSGKLIGRVVNQRLRNHKEYLLAESLPVPHRTLVDQVLKVRLSQWNFCQAEKGDGYTEWFRNISLDEVRDHIRDVVRIVTALYC